MKTRHQIIHIIAKALGVLVHIHGRPYGSSRNVPRTGGGVQSGLSG